MCFLLGIACRYDYKSRRIPNGLILGCLLAGLGTRLWEQGISGIGGYLGNILLTTMAFYLFFYIGAMGAGDVKLLGACAGFFPAGRVLYFLFFALLFAAIFALCKMYRAHNLLERLCYLGEYVWDVVRCGQWRVYFAEDRASEAVGICMAGPILCSVLLYVGGIY